MKKSLLLFLFIIPATLSAQYEKNPLLPITNEGYEMVVGKFVKIPDDNGQRPRINCITFMQDRMFASVELNGRIYEITDDGDGTYSSELFFDVKSAILANTGRELASSSGSYHSGLRSVAFHPDFMDNGKFYTSVMEERPADTTGHHYLSDIPDHIDADGVLIEWTYDFESSSVDENSYRELFRVAVPQFDHPIKQIAFNPYAQPADEDYGLLYLGHGDGNIYNMPDAGGQNNDGRGKIIRIDPLATDTTDYSIPPGNPFVGDTAWLDEIYATGFRNPHSLCFAQDDAEEVHLISSNAGRDNIEEVNVVTPGENYGWTPREGTYVQLQPGGLNSGIEALPDDDAQYGYTYPAAQWSHTSAVFNGFGGLSIVGGYVYTVGETGEKIYLSADFPQSGIVMYNYLDELLAAKTKLDVGNPDLDEPEELTQAPFMILNVYFDDDGDEATPPVAKNNMRDVINDDPDYDGSSRSDLRFGQDMNENIYISSKRNGWIYKIESISPASPTAITQSSVMSPRDFELFPNPANPADNLNLYFSSKLDSDVHLQLVNLDGKVILTKQLISGSQRYNISLSDIQPAPGMYLIQMSNEEFVLNKTLVIQ